MTTDLAGSLDQEFVEDQGAVLIRVHKSLIGHPRLDDLSARAVAYAGMLLPHLPDAFLAAVVDAWEQGHLLPLAAAAAQWAWMNQHPLLPSDAGDALVGCLCELASRGVPGRPRLVRVSPASEFGMGGHAQDRVGEEFVYAEDLEANGN